MSTYLLKCYQEPISGAPMTVEIKFHATNITAVIEAFEDFLKGCGFGSCMEGRALELVDREQE